MVIFFFFSHSRSQLNDRTERMIKACLHPAFCLYWSADGEAFGFKIYFLLDRFLQFSKLSSLIKVYNNVHDTYSTRARLLLSPI